MEGGEMVTVQSYRELIAWQKAMDLVVQTYRVTLGCPRNELYGLTNQVRRASVSVPANIAEGQGRSSTKEFLHHLSIAHGSLREVETHLLISQRLGYTDESTCNVVLSQASEVGRILQGLMKSLQ